MRWMIFVLAMVTTSMAIAKECRRGPTFKQSPFDCLHKDCDKNYWGYGVTGKLSKPYVGCMRLWVRSDHIGLLFVAKSKFGGPNIEIRKVDKLDQRRGNIDHITARKRRNDLLFPKRQYVVAKGDVTIIPFGPTDSLPLFGSQYQLTYAFDNDQGVVMMMTDRINIFGQAVYAMVQQQLIDELGNIASRLSGRTLREGREVFQWTSAAAIGMILNSFDAEVTAAQLTSQFLAEYYGDQVAPRELRVFLATMFGNIYADIQKEVNRVRRAMASTDRDCSRMARHRRRGDETCDYHYYAGVPN